MEKTIEIPKGYEARTEGRKVIIELKESEDERIRKELLSFIKSVQHSYLCATDRREKWIAYLEKQKDEAQKQFNLGVQAGKEEVLYEMEKEQKPVEWSEEDIKHLNSILYYLNRPFHDMSEEELADFNWLKSLRPQPYWTSLPSNLDEAAKKEIERFCSDILNIDIIWARMPLTKRFGLQMAKFGAEWMAVQISKAE